MFKKDPIQKMVPLSSCDIEGIIGGIDRGPLPERPSDIMIGTWPTPEKTMADPLIKIVTSVIALR